MKALVALLYKVLASCNSLLLFVLASISQSHYNIVSKLATYKVCDLACENQPCM